MLHGQIKKGRTLTLATGGLLQDFREPRVDGDIKVEVVSLNEEHITVKAVDFAYRNQCVQADRLKPVGNIFKIGDRVQCIDGDGDIYTGATGTVLDNNSYPYVAWDTEQIDTYKEGDNKYVMSIDEVRLVHSNTVAPVPEPSYSVGDLLTLKGTSKGHRFCNAFSRISGELDVTIVSMRNENMFEVVAVDFTHPPQVINLNDIKGLSDTPIRVTKEVGGTEEYKPVSLGKDVATVDEGEPSLSKSEWLEAIQKLANISPENVSLTISFNSANKI